MRVGTATCSSPASPRRVGPCGHHPAAYHAGLCSPDALAGGRSLSRLPVVRLVLDNLNTHRVASLYETFPAPEARRIARRLEFHYMPKHGSWLNMAEIEFSVLARACLRGRNGDEESLEKAVNACVPERNSTAAAIRGLDRAINHHQPINVRMSHPFVQSGPAQQVPG